MYTPRILYNCTEGQRERVCVCVFADDSKCGQKHQFELVKTTSLNMDEGRATKRESASIPVAIESCAILLICLTVVYRIKWLQSFTFQQQQQ